MQEIFVNLTLYTDYLYILNTNIGPNEVPFRHVLLQDFFYLQLETEVFYNDKGFFLTGNKSAIYSLPEEGDETSKYKIFNFYFVFILNM